MVVSGSGIIRGMVVSNDSTIINFKLKKKRELKTRENELVLKVLGICRELYGENVSFSESVEFITMEMAKFEEVPVVRLALLMKVGELATEITDINKQLEELGE